MPRELLERDAELRALDELLAATSRHDGHTLVYCGQAGLGKTSLLEVARRRAAVAGVLVLSARGLMLEQEFAGGLARQLFLRRLRESPAELRGQLTGALPDSTSSLLDEYPPRFSRDFDVFSALHGLFWLADNLAAGTPCLVVVDDAQWADELSLRFLSYLQERLSQTSIGLLIARRPGEGGNSEVLGELVAHRDCTQLALRPLGERTVSELSHRALGGGRADAHVCRTIFELTRGNPFYVRELLREAVREDRDAVSILASLQHSSSAAITRQVLLRIGRSGKDAARLAQAIAVAGDGADLRVVAGLADLDLPSAVAAVAQLATRDILAPDEAIAYAHPLVAKAVYDDIPAAERGLRHRRAATLLDAIGATPEQVAAQLLRTRPRGDDWVGDQLLRAASAAQARGGTAEIVTYLSRALKEPPSTAQRGEALVRLGEAETAQGVSGGEERLTAALSLATGARQRAQVALRLGRLQIAAGQHRRACTVLGTTLDTVELDDELALEVGAAYLNAATYSPETRADAFTWATALTSAADEGPAARQVCAVRALHAAEVGEPFDSVVALCTKAWQDGSLLDDSGPDGLTWRLPVWALLLVCDPRTAWTIANAVVESAQRLHTRAGYVNGLLWRAYSGRMLGKLDDASADLEHVADAIRHAHWAESLGYAMAAAADVALDRGDIAAAAASITLAGEPHDLRALGTPFVLAARGRLRAAQGDQRGALQDALAAGRILEEQFAAHFTAVPWRVLGALSAHALGDSPTAARLAADETDVAEQVGGPGMLGRASYVTGIVQRSPQCLSHAVELLHDAGLVLLRVDAQLALAQLLHEDGQRGTAQDLLRSALQVAEMTGSRPRSSQARHQLSAMRVQPRRRATTGVDALTPTELRTAELAGTGHSNRDIAAMQFVTIKAVEWHLNNAYRKLGISRRSELRSALNRT